MATEADIRQELSNCADFTDAAGIIWRVSLIEMRIKKQSFNGNYTHGWMLHKKYEDIRKLAGDWQRITTRLAHDAVDVLPPETALPADISDHTPEAITSQWKRANAGLLEIVRFGAMLVEVEGCLKRQTTSKSKHDPSGEGPSLKKWIELHCPDINYKTSMGYKVVAEQMRDKFKIPAKLPLTLALPRSDGTIEAFVPDTVKIDKRKVEKYQREFYGMCEGKSMYQLTLDLGLREPKPKGGDRNTPKHLSAKEKHAKQIDAAREVFRRDLDSLLNHIRRSHHLLLGEAHLDVAIHKAEVLLARLKDAKGVGVDKNRQKEA